MLSVRSGKKNVYSLRWQKIIACSNGNMRADGLVLRPPYQHKPAYNGLCQTYAPSARSILLPPCIDSLEILDQQNLIKVARVIGAPLSHVVLTDYGFLSYAEAYLDDYQQTVTAIAALLVNENISQNDQLAARIAKPVALVGFVLNLMESNGYIKKSSYVGGLMHVWQISPSLKRALQSAG